MSGAASYRRIYAVVRRIPRGKVASYGQIAALAGLPGHARQVGYALHALDGASEAAGLPWHRVVNARGMISPRADPLQPDRQRAMLEAEGIELDPRGRIDFERFGWSGRSRR